MSDKKSLHVTVNKKDLSTRDPFPYAPDGDGVDHVRVGIGCKTQLGMELSVGMYRPFSFSEFGRFNSVLAFWLWYDSGKTNESLRDVWQGSVIRTSFSGLEDTPGVRELVLEALKVSIRSNQELKNNFNNNTLPFTAYDTISSLYRSKPSVYPATKMQWYLDALNRWSKENL